MLERFRGLKTRSPGLKSGAGTAGSRVISAVPTGLTVSSKSYPGLRPGLLSAVPPGLIEA